MSSVNILPAKVDILLSNIVEKEKFVSYTLHKRQKSLEGGNYFADIYEVDIKGKTKNGDKELNLFVKINYGSDDTTYLSINNVFIRELFVYKELFEILAEVQENAKVPIQERFKTVKFYDVSTSEIVILENIAKKGFKPYHNKNVVTLKFAELSIKELAKLHALSFVLEEKLPEYFNTKIKNLKTVLTLGEDWFEFLKKIITLTVKYVDDAVAEKVKKTYFKLADNMVKYFDDKTTKSCICHGDYKAGNMMMKTVNEEVSEIIPIDYQLLYYGCPVTDLIYFIFLNTDKQFRAAHMLHLKDLYFESLKTFLMYFNMDVELVYPRKMFEAVYKEKLDYGLIMSLGILSIMLEDSVPDFSAGLVKASIKISDTYKERQLGIIEDFMDWGYIT